MSLSLMCMKIDETRERLNNGFKTLNAQRTAKGCLNAAYHHLSNSYQHKLYTENEWRTSSEWREWRKTAIQLPNNLYQVNDTHLEAVFELDKYMGHKLKEMCVLRSLIQESPIHKKI